MPGFTLNVQGLDVLFKILEGLTGIANPILSGLIENELPCPARENRNLGWVVGMTGIGDNCLPLPNFSLTPSFLRAYKRALLDSGSRAERRCGQP